MNKKVNLILLAMGLYALSGGLFYSFQELWLSSNNLTIKTIGTIWSLGALLSVSVIFLSSNLIRQNKLKKFTTSLFLIKSIIIFVLFLLNNSGLNIIIKFLILCDYVIDVEIFASIYPLITIITKNDKIYAMNGLIYTFLYYIGVFFTSFLLGKRILGFSFDYNIYLLLASIVIFIGFLIIRGLKMDNYYSKEANKIENNILSEVVNKIKKDKISYTYLLYLFFGNISYYIVTALTITLLTEFLGFTPVLSGYIILVVGILAAILGFIILYKFTFKNNYINFSLKFVLRLITYLIAVLFASKGFYLLALLFTRITSESYSHITDAPYINRFDGKYQLAFCNFKEMVKYASKSIGTFLCGFLLAYGVRYNFLVASILISLQMFFGFNAIYLRNKESKELK